MIYFKNSYILTEYLGLQLAENNAQNDAVARLIARGIHRYHSDNVLSHNISFDLFKSRNWILDSSPLQQLGDRVSNLERSVETIRQEMKENMKTIRQEMNVRMDKIMSLLDRKRTLESIEDEEDTGEGSSARPKRTTQTPKKR